MPMMSDKDRKAVAEQLEELDNEVRMIVFTQETECMYCKETRNLVTELSELSDKTSLEIYDFVKDKDIADKYKIDKIPATVVMGDEDYGIRFFGIPSGYEFASLLQSVKMIGAGDSGLSQKSRDFLKNLEKELHFQVFVTPT